MNRWVRFVTTLRYTGTVRSYSELGGDRIAVLVWAVMCRNENYFIYS